MTSSDWQTWWNESVAQSGEQDLFRQVGRTVGGVPTGESDLDATTEAILEALELSGSEVVLDLCCGNGLLSQKIASHCRTLIGVDFSAPLIEVARRLHGATATFVVSDVSILTPDTLGVKRINAAYLAFAFQYLSYDKASQMLKRIRMVAAPGFRLFIEGIPDQGRINVFYDTPKRKREHVQRKDAGIEHVENWWTHASLLELSASEGFDCAIITQEADRVCKSYRFDALLKLKDC
jgi:ubiquinone/menaquinone biosynthesis C-methylase UbiE